MKCHLMGQGLQFELSALIDCGAGGEAFIHPKFLPAIEKYFQIEKLRINRGGAGVSTFNNKHGATIDTVFTMDLLIDGRRIPTWFLVCDTGRHDIFLGRIWLAKNRALVDCEDRVLRWKDEQSYQDQITGVPTGLTLPPAEIARTGQGVQVNDQHQTDANRRDALMEQQIRNKQIKVMRRHQSDLTVSKGSRCPTPPSPAPPQPPNPQPHHTHTGDLRNSYNVMDKELRKEENKEKSQATSQRQRLRSCWAEARAADICLIEASNFLRSAKREEVVIGATSLYEINKLIEDREQADEPQEPEEIERLLDERLPPWLQGYRDVFSKVKADALPPHREGVDHDIQLEGESNLAPSPLYSMSTEHLRLMKEYLEENLQKGFIVPSNAPYASPVLFAKKPGGGWRFCVDYRKLNAITKKDRYPIPLIEETLARLSRARVFTRLDVRHAFNRIRLKESVEDLTTFRTRYGSYKYRVLPFGLCNGPASFQRYINSILFDYLDDFCTAYIDDILIYSSDPLEHQEQVHKVLERLREAGLPVDVKKSEFAVTSTKFLGFIVSTEGIAMDLEKVAVVRDWKTPTSLKGVQSFLGFCNFYRRFLKEYGRVARPLTRLTAKNGWHPLKEVEIEAFNKVKELMLSGGMLAHYSPSRPTQMETDASDGVVAGVLSQQQDNGDWKPIAFFSKTMTVEEMNYEIHDKEMLAVIRGLAEWRPLLIGLQSTPFRVLTDHRALEYFATKRLLNPRQARWADSLADYHLQIMYRPGSQNTIADILSRKKEILKTQKEKYVAERTTTLIKPTMIAALEDLPTEQSDANESTPSNTEGEPAEGGVEETPASALELIDQILKANREHESLQRYRDLAGQKGWEMRQGLLLRWNRLVVPNVDQLRTKLIREAHVTPITAHPGKTKTRKLLTERYYWINIGSDVDTYVANCRQCNWSHVPRDRTPGLLHPLPIGERCWQHVSFDFKQFPKDKNGYDNVFVIVDRLGKRAFSLPCTREATAETAAKLYYQNPWRIYGTPETVTSDRGPQFISAFMDELCKLTGVKQKLSTAYHPQTDGNTEILNQYIDQRLRPFINHFQDNWADLLPAMDFAQAILPHESTGLSPYELELGHKPRLHFDWENRTRNSATPREQLTREEAQQFAKRAHEAVEFARQNLKKAQERQSQQANKHRREPDFNVGDHVYVTRKGWATDRPSTKLDYQLAGPFKILEMKGHSYVVDIPEHMRMDNVFSADRLRRAATNPLPGQIEPPPPPTEINGQPEYNVTRILASRVRNRVLQYKAEWEGYDPDDTWYDADSFINSASKVKEFHDTYPDEAGPPVRLQQWLEAARRDETLDPVPEDLTAVKTGRKRAGRRHR